MIRYFFKRIAEAIPVFFLIVTAVFFMIRFVPSGPFDKERPASAETIEALNKYYGLDEPLYVQYFSYLKNLAHGELGPSFKYSGWSVNEILAEKAMVSLELGTYALVIALIFGFLPPNFATPSSTALAIASLIFWIVSLSSFGIIIDTEYFGF